MNTYLKFSTLAFQMAAVIGLLTYAGVKLDKRIENPYSLFTILGALLGIAISFYFVFKELKNLK
ncbi:AtpZ/AtpI family protein [Thermaurantimonas aggregans]|nr:AtpZ/AtpI family protein [Thermaurantimonas aggregans]MCX8148268.1 AtpZ/AtpI family protein [Thermaurantimonas aggregans]